MPDIVYVTYPNKPSKNFRIELSIKDNHSSTFTFRGGLYANKKELQI